MTVKVKIGEQTFGGDASSLPIHIWVEECKSQNFAVFYVNGTEYHLYISKEKKLVVTK